MILVVHFFFSGDGSLTWCWDDGWLCQVLPKLQANIGYVSHIPVPLFYITINTHFEVLLDKYKILSQRIMFETQNWRQASQLSCVSDVCIPP